MLKEEGCGEPLSWKLRLRSTRVFTANGFQGLFCIPIGTILNIYSAVGIFHNFVIVSSPVDFREESNVV